MEHTSAIQTVDSAPEALSLTERQAEFITFLYRSNGDLVALQQHFEISARELVDFLSSKLCQDKVRGMLESMNLVLQLAATQVQHVAMQHLKNVCIALETQPDKVEKLRLSATALGRLATSARPARQTTSRRSAAQVENPEPDSAATRAGSLPEQFQNNFEQSRASHTAARSSTSSENRQTQGGLSAHAENVIT